MGEARGANPDPGVSTRGVLINEPLTWFGVKLCKFCVHVRKTATVASSIG